MVVDKMLAITKGFTGEVQEVSTPSMEGVRGGGGSSSSTGSCVGEHHIVDGSGEVDG